MLVICKTNGPKYLYLAYAWKPITDWLESISTAQWRHRFNIKSKPDLSAFWSKLDDFFSRNNCNILRLRKKNLKIVLIYTNSNQGTLVIKVKLMNLQLIDENNNCFRIYSLFRKDWLMYCNSCLQEG